jgi:hypothetical protein
LENDEKKEKRERTDRRALRNPNLGLSARRGDGVSMDGGIGVVSVPGSVVYHVDSSEEDTL